MLSVGAAVADITPRRATPLSGFAARAGQLSTGIHSPLEVRALALKQEDALPHVLYSLDLVGLGHGVTTRLLDHVEAATSQLRRERCLLVATHSHSGPPTQGFVGEPPLDNRYLERVADTTAAAGCEALARLEPAEPQIATVRVPGLTYNRRALLADGSVSIVPEPDGVVLSRGPVDDRLTVIVWRTPAGREVATIAHFACHGVALLTQAVSADVPGAISKRIQARIGAPCLFLPGAGGDINPTAVAAGSAELSGWVAEFDSYLDDMRLAPIPGGGEPFRALRSSVRIPYASFPPEKVLREEQEAYQRIVTSDPTTRTEAWPSAVLSELRSLGVGDEQDIDQIRYICRVLANSAQRRLAAARAEGRPREDLQTAVWWLGDSVALLFFGAEIFASTGQRIARLLPDTRLLTVSCLAPLIGYVPTDGAVRQGGYEVEHAWRFYGQPNRFSPGAEARLIAGARALLEMTRG